jgi:hypothetical protein
MDGPWTRLVRLRKKHDADDFAKTSRKPSVEGIRCTEATGEARVLAGWRMGGGKLVIPLAWDSNHPFQVHDFAGRFFATAIFG